METGMESLPYASFFSYSTTFGVPDTGRVPVLSLIHI